MGRKIGNLKKEDYLFVGLVASIIVLAFVFLPKYFPQIFSSAGQEIGRELGSIIGVGG